MANWQVHRFGDAVAVSTGTGETVYLEPKQARAMARAISKAARSIVEESFGQSSGLTKSGECIAPDKENRRAPRLDRDETGRAIMSKRVQVAR